MKKTTFSVLLVLFSMASLVSRSQSVNMPVNQPDTATYPYWIEMMMNPESNFFATQRAFYTYWNGRPVTRGSGYKPFKRWEYMTALRVRPDGSRPAPDRDLKAYNAYLSSHGSRSVSGAWTSLGPYAVPSGNNGYRGMGRVNAVAFHPTDPDKIYAGAPAGGLWISADHGLTWTSTTDVLPTLGVSAIAVDYADPDVIYMGTGDRDAGDAPGLGVWKSLDGGLTWAPFNTGMATTAVSRLAISPQDHNTVFAATSGGIFKSTDGGINWTKKISGTIKDLVFKPGNPTVIYATNNGTFLKSTDGGENFVQGATGLPSGSRGAIAVSPANPEIVYVFLTNSDSFKGLYRSTDSGSTFTERSTTPNIMSWDCNGGDGGQAWYDLDVAADPANADVIYGGGVNCFKSTDGGLTWNIRSHWYGGCGVQSVHADLHVLEYSPLTGQLFAGNDGGLYFTGNGGVNWTEISNGMVISQAYKIGQSATNPDYVINGYQDNGTSSYTGSDWVSVGGGDGMECAYDPVDDRYSYSTVYYGSINRNFNHASQGQIAGEGVNGITEGGAWVTPFLVDYSDGNTMYIGYKNVWRSKNIKASNTNSVSWTKISDINSSNFSVLVQSKADPAMLYAAYNNRLYRTDNAKDLNVAWSDLTNTLVSTNTITAIETSPIDANVVFVVQQNRVFRSDDKGRSWNEITGTLPDVQMNTLAYYRNSQDGLYMGTDIGVFYRDNFLGDWILYSDGLPASSKITEVEIYYDPAGPQGDMIRAGTYGRGLWESPLYFSMPSADFTADKTLIPTSCPVRFTDLSSGVPFTWNWTFDGAQTPASTVQNPSGISWDVPGEYTVSLEVSNPDGTATETKTAYITVSDTLLPFVDFSCNQRIFCSGPDTVRFTDHSDYCPDAWQWQFSPGSFSFIENTNAFSQNPVVVFNGPGNYSVSLTTTNSNGSRSLTRNNYILFGGAELPFAENWESASLSANGWTVVNPDNKSTWEICSVQGNSPGNTAVRMNFFDYAVPPGQHDQLISPAINLSGFTTAFLSFEHAYCRRYSQITDSLLIRVSGDCGNSWTLVAALGEDGTGIFETHPVSTSLFTPETPDDWCGAAGNPGCFLIDLSQWAGNSNVKVMFESVHRRGNALYLDNISISDLVAVPQYTALSEGISVFPNPASNAFVIESVKPWHNPHIRIFAADGSQVYSKPLETGKQWSINQPGLKQGIYILQMSSGSQVSKVKLLIH